MNAARPPRESSTCAARSTSNHRNADPVSPIRMNGAAGISPSVCATSLCATFRRSSTRTSSLSPVTTHDDGSLLAHQSTLAGNDAIRQPEPAFGTTHTMSTADRRLASRSSSQTGIMFRRNAMPCAAASSPTATRTRAAGSDAASAGRAFLSKATSTSRHSAASPSLGSAETTDAPGTQSISPSLLSGTTTSFAGEVPSAVMKPGNSRAKSRTPRWASMTASSSRAELVNSPINTLRAISSGRPSSCRLNSCKVSSASRSA